jgi:hypothetical protein
MQAMWGMVKLDVEGLKRAYEGKSVASHGFRGVGKATACPPVSMTVRREMVGTAHGRLCPSYIPV